MRALPPVLPPVLALVPPLFGALATVAASALLASCFTARTCPTDRALQRDDLPCECGGVSLDALPYCGSLTCDPAVGGVFDACDRADSGDSGDTGSDTGGDTGADTGSDTGAAPGVSEDPRAAG